MGALGEFLLSSWVGSNTQEFNNLRNLSTPKRNQTPNSSDIIQQAGPSTNARAGHMTRATERPIEESRDSKEGPLPSGPDPDDEQIAPPPYSVLPTPSTSTAPQSIYSAPSMTGDPHKAPQYSPEAPIPSTSSQTAIQSDAVNATRAVELVGPLNIQGSVKSSSRIDLTDEINVGGKVSSSSNITLTNGIFVDGKVSASGKIVLNGGKGGVRIASKADASGHVKIFGGDGGVVVGDKVNCSGSCSILGEGGGVRIGGKVGASGSIEIREFVDIGGDLSGCGDIKIGCVSEANERKETTLRVGGVVKASGGVKVAGNVKVEGDLNVGGKLAVDGRLIVNGDLTVKGNITLQPGSELIVSGKRTIHGSLKQL